MYSHEEGVQQRRGWMRLVAIVALAVLAFLIASYYFINSWYEDNLQAVSAGSSEEIVVVIPQGASVRDIGDQLANLGVIRNSTVFSWYVGRNDGRGDLQAGTYVFTASDDVETIVTKLQSGEVATQLLTILPGKRLDQLEADFVAAGFGQDEVTQALSRRYDHPLLSNLPVGSTIEGYIFPETYRIDVGNTAEDVILQSFDQFSTLLTPEIEAGIADQGLTLHEAVILASIVDAESGNVDEQDRIAQVFLKRLDEGIALGSDVTFLYAAAITNQQPAVDLDSPYNTRIYAGLPPGPIGNFNFSALEAVANPADTDFLYFVAGDDGITRFTRTLAEHEAATAQFCDVACQLPVQE